ncbi:RHS repeat-associated protein [Xanthomonas arboricola]|uniref:RHS repeat-associated core domain-containing protein n=1 Tax=Xanthomonas arboricola TaxID=56448 RepID=UPI00161CC444|nr:RHS repeat-associated core domain-containing protein [Xanthomonas arboricola]MBB4607345.1 RHS repeat-associated protein [Xanthomonas arboricola]
MLKRISRRAALLLALAWPATGLAETVEYIHTDALGSPVAITDAAGNVIERTVYEPYGGMVNKAAVDGPGFTGHVTDSATGLSYMQQRYYDPLGGRFLSVDPISADESTSNFNRYLYVNNNPYKFVDPDGRQALTFMFGGVEQVLLAEQAYGAYRNGRVSAAYAAQAISAQTSGDVGGRLEELRQIIRSDAVGLKNERRNGVRRAWADEQRMVRESGTGTRPWTRAQLSELLATGTVSGFVGHHVNSVQAFPELAGVPDNVAFIPGNQHIGEHGGNYRNQTQGPMLQRSASSRSISGRIGRIVETGTRIIKRGK